MRLWSIHPRHLDGVGLTALWRESLLARKVLRGETRGYRRHPQLDRFRGGPGAIERYLCVVWEEADRRGYHFDRSKLAESPDVPLIPVTKGQVDYEVGHLRKKLSVRSPEDLSRLWGEVISSPVFAVVPGDVEPWERITPR